MKLHDCDICGSSDPRPIWVAKYYIRDWTDPPVICQNCGFVYVRERRSSQEIAEDWKRIYKEKIYDPNWPGVKARLYYVAEWMEQNIGFQGKSILDIGGGAGTFSNLVEANFDRFDEGGFHISAFDPAFGGVLAEDKEADEKFDIVTILWTLENCGDCNAMISKARECLKPDGHLVVATGSRILVPFRKPMSSYFSKEPQDLHAFRWSKASLANMCRKHDFEAWFFNDYQQNDVLLMTARPGKPLGAWPVIGDDPTAVENHFIDWYRMFP